MKTQVEKLRDKIRETVNNNPALQGLLYDRNLLPEQIKEDDVDRWHIIYLMALSFETGKGQGIADLNKL